MTLQTPRKGGGEGMIQMIPKNRVPVYGPSLVGRSLVAQRILRSCCKMRIRSVLDRDESEKCLKVIQECASRTRRNRAGLHYPAVLASSDSTPTLIPASLLQMRVVTHAQGRTQSCHGTLSLLGRLYACTCSSVYRIYVFPIVACASSTGCWHVCWTCAMGFPSCCYHCVKLLIGQ